MAPGFKSTMLTIIGCFSFFWAYTVAIILYVPTQGWSLRLVRELERRIPLPSK